jgi:hypothetical protein
MADASTHTLVTHTRGYSADAPWSCGCHAYAQTKAERRQAAKDKMLDIGENLESGKLLDGSVDPTEVTAFW